MTNTTSNKVAIITGGSRGVGAATAKLLASKGWNVTITCTSSIQDANEVDIDFTAESGEENILRFHNNIKVMNSYITWQGNVYFPIPIEAQGFDISSRGTLPTPILRLTAQNEEGIGALKILRRTIDKYGDIVGAKVTRIRTFAKYLDSANFSDISQPNKSQGSYASSFPDGYEPDPYSEFPRDIFS